MMVDGGPRIFKLTQKIAAPGSGAQQGFVTSIYLTEGEFCTLAKLRVKKLNKIRHSVPPFGVDVFEDRLEGLLLAKAEFDLAAEAESQVLASFILHEVSSDERFTGGRLISLKSS